MVRNADDQHGPAIEAIVDSVAPIADDSHRRPYALKHRSELWKIGEPVATCLETGEIFVGYVETEAFDTESENIVEIGSGLSAVAQPSHAPRRHIWRGYR